MDETRLDTSSTNLATVAELITAAVSANVIPASRDSENLESWSLERARLEFGLAFLETRSL